MSAAIGVGLALLLIWAVRRGDEQVARQEAERRAKQRIPSRTLGYFKFFDPADGLYYMHPVGGEPVAYDYGNKPPLRSPSHPWLPSTPPDTSSSEPA